MVELDRTVDDLLHAILRLEGTHEVAAELERGNRVDLDHALRVPQVDDALVRCADHQLGLRLAHHYVQVSRLNWDKNHIFMFFLVDSLIQKTRL